MRCSVVVLYSVLSSIAVQQYGMVLRCEVGGVRCEALVYTGWLYLYCLLAAHSQANCDADCDADCDT